MHPILLLAVAVLPASQIVQSGSIGQTSVTDSTISIGVSRSARLAADRVSMYVAVEGGADTPAGAVERLQSRLVVVQDTLRTLGRKVQAERPLPFAMAQASREGSFPASSASAAYIARAVIRIVIPRLDDMASVQASLLGAGALNTSAHTFQSARADSAWSALVADAISAARQTATLFATAQGRQLGALIETNAGSSGNYQQHSQISFETRYGNNSGAAPEVPVTANVTLRFRLLPK